MPIFEYYCGNCKSPYAHIIRNGVDKPCPDCGLHGERVVSVPAWRPDKTITEAQ